MLCAKLFLICAAYIKRFLFFLCLSVYLLCAGSLSAFNAVWPLTFTLHMSSIIKFLNQKRKLLKRLQCQRKRKLLQPKVSFTCEVVSNCLTPHACVFCLFILCLWSVSIWTIIIHHFCDLKLFHSKCLRLKRNHPLKLLQRKCLHLQVPLFYIFA